MKFSPVLILLLALGQTAIAQTYLLPANGDNVIGDVQKIAAVYEDTFIGLSRAYKIGYTELRLANPQVDPWLPGAGTLVTLPTLYVLPDVPREGIVINLAEMRLYYYPPVTAGEPAVVYTYPIGIGREAYPTPEIVSEVRARIPNPAWYPPQSLIAENAALGISTPRVVPPGPDNPLGDYAIQLGVPGYFIHGTNRPAGVGMRVSRGCIRMYPEDIADLFNRVSAGTPVRIVHQPIKVGVREGEIYVEVHPATQQSTDSASWLVSNQLARLVGQGELQMNWDLLDQTAASATGIPQRIAQLQEDSIASR